MNPSASGWIDKLNKLVFKHPDFVEMQEGLFYENLRASGFIYGSNVKTAFPIPTDLTLSEDEITKVNLFLGLVYYYRQSYKTHGAEEAIKEILSFYKEIKVKKLSFLDKILIGSECSAQLEKVLDSRIRLKSNMLTQNFSSIITNALLFSDVLAFINFLQKKKDPEAYAIQLENRISTVVYNALNSKAQKTEYDELLIKLVASSMRYHQNEEVILLEEKDAHKKQLWSAMADQYVLDLACMAVWDDAEIDSSETHFLWSLGNDLNIARIKVENSLTFIQEFIGLYRDQMSFFNTANPVKTFYEQSSKTVSKLILRNKNRLTKELTESGELMVLLTRSTVKDLTDAEKQKVKEQLLDICKSIPSLAIFALPGGGLLLPLLVKFIPKLLPSAFNENKIVDEE
ncbi:LETM1-related biofilm-associated protein [Ascidiimonas sp. W6]|uniref:LETM1-related biofilm-associated protein n=1 Tax=Ascidiimonas meishanensis TaxID=3128903 RepID=UPI0030ED145A